MTDTGLAIKILLGVAMAVAVTSLVPPLTSWSPPEGSGPDGNRRSQVVRDNGYGFCRETLPGADCACFARTAGEILNGDTPRASGWDYADSWDLARAQATDTCS